VQISLKTYTLSQINGIISNKKLIQNAQGRSGIYIINFLKRLRQILIPSSFRLTIKMKK